MEHKYVIIKLDKFDRFVAAQCIKDTYAAAQEHISHMRPSTRFKYVIWSIPCD